MVSLCFGRQGLYLGALWTDEGAFAKWSASPSDTVLGPVMEGWKKRGVPMTRSAGMTSPKGSRAYVRYATSVEARSPEFCDAVRAWGVRHAVTLVDLDPKRFPYWETLLRLPMNPLKRFTLLLDLRTAAETELKNWKALFEELERVGFAARDGVRARFATAGNPL